MLTRMFTGGDPTDMTEVGVEKAIGQIKIGNNEYTVYFKMIDCGNTTANTAKYIATGLTANDYVGILDVHACGTNGSSWFVPIPYPLVASGTQHAIYFITSGTYAHTLYLQTANAQTKVYAYLYYYR